MDFLSRTPVSTKRLGAQLAQMLQPHDVIALVGQIGAGKTTFVQGIATGLGVPQENVTSPSFVLIKEYHGGRMPIFHADLFRLEGADEAMSMGLEECYQMPGVTVIEWANQVPSVMPEEFLEVQFEVVNRTTRRLRMVPHGKKYEGRNWLKGNRREASRG